MAGGAIGDPVRRNAQLGGNRARGGETNGVPRREWQESNLDRCAVPTRDRHERDPDRVRGGIEAEHYLLGPEGLLLAA